VPSGRRQKRELEQGGAGVIMDGLGVPLRGLFGRRISGRRKEIVSYLQERPLSLRLELIAERTSLAKEDERDG
jgi:hypothetical protein